MNRIGSILLLTTALAFPALSQELIHYPAPALRLDAEPGSGKNGAAVAYSPDFDRYYAVFAGNANFPLITFSAEGKRIAQKPAGNDLRGIWWNPREETLEGNCYQGIGLVEIGLMDRGVAGAGNRLIFEENWQPDDQSVGVYDNRRKEVLYYYDGKVFGYSRKNGKPEGVLVRLELPVEAERINRTSMIYTGYRDMEIGLLDVVDEKVYLFDRKKGTHTETIHLPKQSVKEDLFNFSFANDHVFLFDPVERTWTGYKVF